mmetsp:Transcript_7253/g.13521  ORF Transcript_7253/g.13521 Transcript_7253/m.13521 type:complete len:744 (+) Transcript_7253:80-2311(+)|eukprot:CAMPEP_0197526734 /NCGR_PEP_ID=MMETSP1318-20131121/19123_1 /TAXON_ID=552666 /ORGANISM="Partenskyella glossopodia, Strain RCC365" /LENGTH=743 /DNA_ID=CAMNT_0043081049 /DNA_START=49 /DNA_END=2280 /DNA_ORIENTATION=+
MANSASLSTIIGPSIFVAIIYLVVFEILRVKWSNFYAPRCQDAPHKGILEWIPGVIRISEKEVIKQSGMDAAVYLRVQQMCTQIILIFTILSCVTTIPVYGSGENGLRDLNRYTISNLSIQSSLLWAPSVMCWVFCAIAMFIIYWHYREVHKLRVQTIGQGKGNEYTIMVKGIPAHLDSEQNIKEEISKTYPNSVVSVSVVRDESNLEARVKLLKKEHIKLLAAKYRQRRHNNTAQTETIGCCSCLGYGEKVEPVSYRLDRIKMIKAGALRAKELSGPFVGVAFVTFDSIATASKAGSTPLSEYPDLWDVSNAPMPSDVIWENVRKIMPSSVKAMVGLTKAAAVFSICVFWSIPVAFINLFSNLDSLIQAYPALAPLNDMSPFWKSVFTGLVPGLLLVILMLLLYPILWAMVKTTGVLTYSKLEIQFMRDYYVFLVIDVFFITMISTSIWDTIQQAIENPKDVFVLLGKSIPTVAVIHMGYILIQTLMVETERIVRVWFLLLSFVFHSTSKSDFEAKQASKPEAFAYGSSLAYSGLIFTICSVYSCIAPLILPFGVMYFSINYVINKYKLLYVQKLRFETYGMFFPKVVTFLFTGIIIGQIALMAVIGLRYGYWQQLVLFPLPIASYLFSTYLKDYYGHELMQLRMPLAAAAHRDDERSEERVKQFLEKWNDQQCWSQPCLSVDLDNPLEHVKDPPEWTDSREISRLTWGNDVKISVPTPREHQPLLAGNANDGRIVDIKAIE